MKTQNLKRFVLSCFCIGMSLIWTGYSKAASGYLGQFIVTDSIDIPFYGMNCYGNRTTADSVYYAIYKDTITATTIPIDTARLLATALPCRQVSVMYGRLVNYIIRRISCGATRTTKTGRYTIQMSVRTDTCWTPFTYWWDVVDTTTLNLVKRIETPVMALLDDSLGNAKKQIDEILKTTEPLRNQLNVYVKTTGSDDSSGLTWQASVASLNEAFAKCTGASQYRVYVASGTYPSVLCSINVSNVEVLGIGRPTLKARYIGGSARYTFLLGQTASVSNIRIAGFVMTSDSTSKANYGNGIRLDSTQYVVIENNEFVCLQTGVDIYPVWTTTTTKRHTVIRDNYLSFVTGDGVIVGGSYNYIHDNFFSGTGSSNADMIAIWSYGYFNSITRNYLFTKWGSCIHILGSDRDSNFIADNYAYSMNEPNNSFNSEFDKSDIFVGNHSVSYQWAQDTSTTTEEDLGALPKWNWGYNDTTVVDSSKTGAWLIANTGGGGGGSCPDSLIARVDSILHATGYDADSTLLTLLRYIRNNQNDYKADVSALLTKAVFDDSIDGKATYAQASAIIDSTGKLDTTLIKVRNQVFDNADSLNLIKYLTDGSLDDSLGWIKYNVRVRWPASGYIASEQNQSDISQDVANLGGWNPITDNDSLIADQSSMRWDLGGGGACNWGDTLGQLMAFRDSVVNAIKDVNKANFKATGFATPSDVRTQTADALSDSGYTFSRAQKVDSTLRRTTLVGYAIGATEDSTRQNLLPFVSANKDSINIFNRDSTCVATGYITHTGSVIQTIRWKFWK